MSLARVPARVLQPEHQRLRGRNENNRRAGANNNR